MSGVKGILGMHRFNICLVVVLLWCENTIITAKAVPMSEGVSGGLRFVMSIILIVV